MRRPHHLNSQLGTWTNFVDLLDLCALALPGGFRDDGLPGGFTLIADLAGYMPWRVQTRWQRHQPVSIAWPEHCRHRKRIPPTKR
nr:hypothetical protein [Alcanivorax sp.]